MSGKDRFDLGGAVQQDAKKVRQLKGGVDRPSMPRLIEGMAWALAILAMMTMIAVMPWVGQDKLIPGAMWLGYSLFAIAGFCLIAGVMRFIRTQGAAIDREMDDRLNVGR